jgi:hypothetical protein
MNMVHGTVYDSFRHRLLSARHQYVDELGHLGVVIFWIGQYFPFWNFSPSWHFLIPVLLIIQQMIWNEF